MLRPYQMRRSTLFLRLIVPAGLVLLVGVLATLQYRWVGQVSEAERERLKTSLRQRADQFADEFNRELLRLYVALQTSANEIPVDDRDGIARRYDAWREEARYPQLVRALFLVKDAATGGSPLRYQPETRTFATVPWPDQLSPIVDRLTQFKLSAARGEMNARALVALHDPVVSAVPAILIPLPVMQPMTRPPTEAFFSLKMTPSVLIAQLDREYLQSSLLPELAARHFPEHEGGYRLAVIDLDNPGHPLVTYGPGAGKLDPAAGDATAPLLSLRMNLTTQVFARQGSPDPAAASRGGTGVKPTTGVSIIVQSKETRGGDVLMPTIRSGSSGWQLIVQHTAGSLDAFVAQTRRRNLWLSFSILAVLAASVGLVALNAQRSQRLAAQQMDFVAAVSHELRTPLAVIRSAAQNLSAGVVSDATQARRYGEVLEEEGRRLTGMVEQVLEYASLSGNRRLSTSKPVDVEAIIRDVVASCASLLESAQMTCSVDLPANLPSVLADELALRRALHNLVVNAIKYGSDGLSLSISARTARAHGHRPEEVHISVTDRGRGIDASDLPHLFDPFYRGRAAIDRQIQGTGLGLSLVKRIVEAHGGRVSVKSSPGAGATFTLHLPAANLDAASEPVAEPAR